MADHPINSIMETSMQKIKEMVDVNTIIGEPVETCDGTLIIPVSKVSFGLAAGGAEYSGTITVNSEKESLKQSGENTTDKSLKYPFGGGSGAGVSITPIAFIIVNYTDVKLLPLSSENALEKLVDHIPTVIDKIKEML
jgi:sporulation protein YtfJ